MKILKIKDKSCLAEAVKTIKRGGVVICPTDTVYGFLASAENKKAVEKIYKLKKRPKSKPLPVFIKNMAMAKNISEILIEQQKIINKKWPGKYTFVLNRKIETKIFGVDKKTVALRLPKLKFLNSLLGKVGAPVVQTSVNISNQPSLNDIKEITEVFGGNKLLDLIIDAGRLRKSKPSSIIDLTQKNIKILRK